MNTTELKGSLRLGLLSTIFILSACGFKSTLGANEWHCEWNSPKDKWMAGLERECTLLLLDHTPLLSPDLAVDPNIMSLEFGEAIPLDNNAGWAFPCLVRPLQSGNLNLPSAKFSSMGNVISTPVCTIEVEAPLHSEDIQLEVQCEKSQLYVGEWTELKVTWTSKILLQDFKALNMQGTLSHTGRHIVFNAFR